PGLERPPPVASHNVAEPDGELRRDGLVEAEARAGLLDDPPIGKVHVLLHRRPDRVARDEPDDHEHEHRDNGQDQERVGEPPRAGGGHRLRRLARDSARPSLNQSGCDHAQISLCFTVISWSYPCTCLRYALGHISQKTHTSSQLSYSTFSRSQ